MGPGSVEWLQLTACAAASSARAVAAAAATAPASAPIAVLRSAACASSSATFAARSDFSWLKAKQHRLGFKLVHLATSTLAQATLLQAAP